MSFSVGVIVVSDRAHSGERKDACIPVVRDVLTPPEFEIYETAIVPDDPQAIKQALESFITREITLIITSGGTGFAPRDNTPEVTMRLIDKSTPGVDEAIRRFSDTKSKYAIFSRAVSGIARKSFVINLPGSPVAVREILDFLRPILAHPLKLIAGEVKDCSTEDTRQKP